MDLYSNIVDGAMMSYIQRAQEDLLKKLIKQGKILLLTGSRQVGKSTIIEHNFPDYNKVNLDDPYIVMQIEEDIKMFFKNNPCPLFIDEVQKNASIFSYIKMICDKSDKRGQFILSGSQNLLMMKNVSDSLAGRVLISNLKGLSLREIYKVNFKEAFIPSENYINKREKKLKQYPDIWKIIHKGFYPELYEKKIDWQAFYSSYVKTYIERDINEFISSDEITFMKFLTAVAARTGQIVDYTSIANNVEVDSKTVKKWMSMLERTGIIYLLQPYSNSALNRAIKRPKVYFADTGLACYLTKWNTHKTLMNGAMAGAMFETFVVSEILKSFANAGLDHSLYVSYYRGKDKLATYDNEIDLIIEQNGILHPIEIKLSASPKASMANANTILDKVANKKRGMGAIICMVDNKTYLRDNLVALPIEFL